MVLLTFIALRCFYNIQTSLTDINGADKINKGALLFELGVPNKLSIYHLQHF